jgi:hypothetical protein
MPPLTGISGAFCFTGPKKPFFPAMNLLTFTSGLRLGAFK